VGEDSMEPRIANADRGNDVRVDHPIQLSSEQHPIDVRAPLERLDHDAGPPALGGAAFARDHKPPNLREIDLVVVQQRTAGPHAGGATHVYPLPLEVARSLDARLRIYVAVLQAELAIREGRDGDVRKLAPP